MNVFPPGLLLYALLVCAALMTACTNPGYNNNPSQQITTPRAGCPVASDFLAVYFSVRVQPSAEYQDPRITKEVFRPYCEEIPTPGKIFLTADLVGDELKRIPIGIRVVEQEFNGDDASRSGNFKDLRIISEVLAKPYPKGVIESDFELDKNGYYAIYLIRSGEGGVSEQDRLRIPLHVGPVAGANSLIPQALAIFGIASVLGLIGVLVFRYVRRRMSI